MIRTLSNTTATFSRKEPVVVLRLVNKEALMSTPKQSEAGSMLQRSFRRMIIRAMGQRMFLSALAALVAIGLVFVPPAQAAEAATRATRPAYDIVVPPARCEV